MFLLITLWFFGVCISINILRDFGYNRLFSVAASLASFLTIVIIVVTLLILATIEKLKKS